ncbi:LAFE_0E09758g1_1 [Lachancea fermentati]|uniref:HECT-type E3 ubiquitin transferase n=1 Tax=Lachancea fermentati TaxID=4955 RepID=A0A1G4MDM4_LACFM|nr:LAFE_0E09758g1_1 [Lachancea fermentati]
MLNFTGQTKRRNVNLGNKSKKSREEILETAKKEREKRALDKKRTESAQLIQSSIRKHLSNSTLYLNLVSTITAENATRIFIAYSVPIFYIVGPSGIQTILNVLINDRRLINVKILRLIGIVGEKTESSYLVDILLSKVNLKFPFPGLFVASIEALMTTASFLIPHSTMLKIMDLITHFGVNDSGLMSRLFAMPRNEARFPDNVDHFMTTIGSRFHPKTLLPDTNTLAFVENLSQIYSTVDSSRKAIFGHWILSSLSRLTRGALVQSKSFRSLYSREFINYLANLDSEQGFEKASWFVRHSPDNYCKNSVLIALIAKRGYVKELHDNVLRQQPIEIQSMNCEYLSCTLLLVDLLEIYLSVSSDYELLNNEETYPIANLVQLTSFIKDNVFEFLWNGEKYDTSLADAFLQILRKIYLRDSRLHFCPRQKDKSFWSNDDAEFLQVNISKYIEEYEKFYRNHSRIGGDEDDVDAAVEQNDMIIREQFLDSLRASFTNRTPTRQFRKLEILSRAPFFIPFQQRVEWFYMLISLDRHRLNLDGSDPMNMFMPWNANHNNSRQQATISRESALDDAFKAFNPIGESFKARLSVTFVNEFGPEAGIDGGGITKEFLTSVSDEGFKDVKYHLFKHNERHEIYPSGKIDSPQHLKYLWFMGKVLGKCLYEHVLIDVSFTDFFLKKILNSQNQFYSSFDDLASLDATLYANLVKLLEMSTAELRALDLHFEVTDEDSLRNVELILNGSNTKVDKSNVLQYVLSVADFKLNRKLNKATRYFCGGLSVMIPLHWVGMFNSVELQMLISGGGKDIDLNDLHANTEYGDYSEQDKTIQYFWRILEEFTPEQRLKFVKFVTSVPRAPLQGFGSLVPRFGIRNAGSDIGRLPTASTCVNLLKLPNYKDKHLLKDKLLYAINAEARFDLS